MRLRFELPHGFWLYPFSKNHPAILMNITAAQTLPGKRVLWEAIVIEPSPEDHTEEVRGLRGVFSVSRLGPVGPRTRYQGMIEEPVFLMLAQELEVLFRFPRRVQNGEYTVEVAAQTPKLRMLMERLRESLPAVTVLAFGRDVMRTCPDTLTPNQHRLLHQALAAGYFEVPRRISLTQLAEALNRSKSGLSRGLAIIEKQLAESSGAAPP